EAFRAYVPLLLSDHNPERAVNAVGDDTIEISDKQGNRARMRFDDKGLPAALTYQLAPMQGQPPTIENTYGEMKEVNGIMMPFRITIAQDGHKAAEIGIQEYKFNQGLKPEDIDKRP